MDCPRDHVQLTHLNAPKPLRHSEVLRTPPCKPPHSTMRPLTRTFTHTLHHNAAHLHVRITIHFQELRGCRMFAPQPDESTDPAATKQTEEFSRRLEEGKSDPGEEGLDSAVAHAPKVLDLTQPEDEPTENEACVRDGETDVVAENDTNNVDDDVLTGTWIANVWAILSFRMLC